MTVQKHEFNGKGNLKELIVDDGPSFNFLRADYKSKEEQGAAKKHQLERAKSSSYVGFNKT